MSPVRAPRALAVILAVLIGLPATLVVTAQDAAAQVWKPKSRAKSKGKARTQDRAVDGDTKAGKAKARGSESKTRKAGAAKSKRSNAAKKSTKRSKAKKPVRDDDDDFTYVEEDFPDDD